MSPIVFLTFILHSAAMAACLPEAGPQTLDPAKAKTIGQLERAISNTVAQGKTFCERDLTAKSISLDHWLTMANSDIGFMAADEEKWAKEILTRKISADAPQEAACALYRDLNELEDFYERADIRMADFNQKLRSVASVMLTLRAEMTVFDQPEKAKQLIACRDELGEREDPEKEAERRELCLFSTKASPELWHAVRLLDQKPQGAAIGLACGLDKKAHAHAEKNIALAKQIDAKGKRLLDSANQYFDELNKNIPARIPEITATRNALDPRGCRAWLAAEDLKIESSTRKLQGAKWLGSSFVLSGPGGKPELLSARHVGFPDGDLTPYPYQLKSTAAKAGKQPHGIEFEVKPGLYDQGKDLVKRSLSSAPKSLTAAPSGTVLPAGEKVRIYGYPTNRDGKFVSHGCELRGIGRNVFDTPSAESYLLSCPGAESHIGGMSGGPVTNEKGEVIGVIAGHNPITNMVVVQPLSRSTEGENLFGFQSVFLYDNCFDGSEITNPDRCQVIPGLTYEKATP